jgi:hypothetical protein
MDVEGIGTNGQPVDLFSYTSSHKKLPEGVRGPPPEVIFDRNKYPPTEQGLRELVLSLHRVAAMHGIWALPLKPVDYDRFPRALALLWR